MDYKSKDTYKHFFNPAPLVNWEDNFKYKIVDSLDELKELLLSNGNNIISFDTETDGLDYNRNEIVGFSFSFNMDSGYYVPLRHEKIENVTVEEPKVDADGNVEVYKKTGLPKMKKVKKQINTPFESNLDPKQALTLVHEALCRAKVALLHNAIFDLMMLRKEGFDISKINMFDTMVLCYNADTNAKGFFGLKPASEHFLGRRATKFKEVLGKAKTFKNINPVDCAHYACSDSGNTFGLFQKLYPLLSQECLDIMKLDNEMVKCFLYYYLDVPIYIDKKVMREYQESINTRRKELELAIFKAVGYPFNIRSKANELSKALQSMGIDTGVYSDKTNNMSVSKDALMNVQDKHPIAKDLIELSSLDKQINSYIDKLAECDHDSDNPDIGAIKVNYRLFGTASGRLSSGTGGKAEDDDYFINLNIQNLPKPKPAIYEAIKISDDPKVGILGWEFTLVHDVKKLLSERPDAYLVEGFSPEINVRKAMRVKDDSELILSADYSGQEIKLAGILSGERNFIQPFIEGKDVHTEMAIKLFGKENYDKEKRKSAKIANFGLLYGGCLGGDTKIMTANGYESISDIVGKKLIWTGYSWKDSLIYSSGIKKLNRVIFSDRSSLKITDNHVVFVFNGDSIVEKKIEDVEVGDILLSGSTDSLVLKEYTYSEKDLITKKHSSFSNGRFTFSGNSHKIWWLVGLMVGDGFWKKQNGNLKGIGITVNPKDLFIINKLESYLKDLDLNFTIRRTRFSDKRPNKKVSMVVYSINSVDFAHFLNTKLGLSEDKSTPSELWTESEENISNYIDGIFSADSTQDGRLIITQNNPVGFNRIQDLQLLLQRIGVASTYYKHPKRECHILSIADMEIFKSKIDFPHNNNNQKYLQSEFIDGDNRDRFYDLVSKTCKDLKLSFEDKKKLGIYDIGRRGIGLNRILNMIDLLNLENLSSLKNFRFKKVLDIEKTIGEEEVFDISVLDGEQSYLANGVLVHNSAPVLQQVAKQYGMNMLDGEAFELYDKWWKANTILDIWRNRQWESVPKNNFTVYDYFGRPRRVKYYLQSDERGIYNFGLRTIISHKIQGTGSSIMRRLLVSLYKKIFSNEMYSKHVRYLSSVHDEVNYCIKKTHFTQWAREIEKMMVYKPNNFEIPIDCGLEVGKSLGELYPFQWEDETKTKLIPKRC